MKYPILIIFFFLSNYALGNTIDSIKTDEDALKFITKLYKGKSNGNNYVFSFKKPDSVYENFICDSTIAKWHIKSWQKMDFNHDHLTDLFIIVYRWMNDSRIASYNIFTIIDNGDNTFNMQETPDYLLLNCFVAMPIYIDGSPYLLYRHYKTKYSIDSVTYNGPDSSVSNYYEEAINDTLIYKYGGFIERNNRKFSPSVKSISFSTTMCFGTCPVFELNISSDGKANYLAQMYNNKLGNFTTTLRPKELKEVWGLIKYLNISHLNDSYYVPATDMATSYLRIHFSNGSSKTIEDYGERGTLGLVRLYRLLFDLRENQNWK